MPGATFLMSPGSGTSPQGKLSWASRRCERSDESGMEVSSLFFLPIHMGRLRGFDCPPCNIAPTEAFWPVDQIDRFVGTGAGFLDGRSAGRDVQHPAAIGKNMRAVCLGAGMEYLHPLDLTGGLQPPDLGAFLVGIRI